ncbi:MAG TPA: PEP/pyruvate-binding domain-containing protein [Herpetosiphonaceae bacterium]
MSQQSSARHGVEQPFIPSSATERSQLLAPLILPLAASDATLDLVGGKGASLARLAIAGLPVPPGFHITTAAYRSFVAANQLEDAIFSIVDSAHADDPASLEIAASQIQALFAAGSVPVDAAHAIRHAYAALSTVDPPVAVRSSATAEDLPELSFAGQQETYLNISGEEHLLDAIKRCWASLWTARAIGYRARHGISSASVHLAVVVQALVKADVAGIMFTANPLTSARDQIVINAAWGLGEAIVSGAVTPDTIVVDKSSGSILSYEIADKALHTVRTTTGTTEEAVPDERRRIAALTSTQTAVLVDFARRIEQLYEQPMDIEWAIEGVRCFILQARPITTLSTAAVDPAWAVPRPNRQYARASVIELLPEPLSPLFATLALPRWNQAMLGMLDELGLADLMIEADNFQLTTVNGYAYYDTTFTPAQTRAFLRHTPEFASFASRVLGNARQRWQERGRQPYTEVVRQWQARELSAIPAAQLLDGVQAILEAAAQHYLAIQSGILPSAYLSEMLFTQVYNLLIKRRDDPPALTFLLGFASMPILAEESLYDLAQWARQHNLAELITATPTERLAHMLEGALPPDDALPPVEHTASWLAFRERFAQHLQRFGHMIYDLDFAKDVPADNVAPLLEAIKVFVSDQARNPHERRATTAAARDHAAATVLYHRRGLRLALFWKLLRLAQTFAPLREDALADVGLGWPVLRRMLREIGRRLAARQAIEEQDDVFWLTADELRGAVSALDADEMLQAHRDSIARRRATWQQARALTPPVALPIQGELRFLGIDYRPWLPAQSEQSQDSTIKGIGASPGRITGRACVLRGPEEFARMQPGDILVAKITTPAWTPLFALARAIVTDVGGPLSHGSIVAREYRIPAVMGTGVATKRIQSGQIVTVDGDSGTVTIDSAESVAA